MTDTARYLSDLEADRAEARAGMLFVAPWVYLWATALQ